MWRPRIEYLNIRVLAFCVVLVLTTYLVQGQELGAQPKFTPFTGVVYDMPIVEHWLGGIKRNDFMEFYSDKVYEYDSIGFINLRRLNIPNTDIQKKGFPGIDQRVRVAMVLHAKMKIDLPACYSFSLTSDDGSRLWINDEQLINNDGSHEMETMADTVGLPPGEYNIKVWYFQGYPYHFGLVMQSQLVDTIGRCPQLGHFEPKQKLDLGHVFFDTDISVLNEAGLKEIRRLAHVINRGKFTKLFIVGHTDDRGSEQYNLELSEKRARNVKDILKHHLFDPNLIVEIAAKGSLEPVDESGTEEGNKKNRRVELILE